MSATEKTNAPSAEEEQEHLVSHQLPAESHERLTRVVCIAVDPSDHGRYGFDWALKNFIKPESDLVVLLNVRNPLAVPAPYGVVRAGAGYMDFSDYAIALEKSHRDASHGFLREYAAKLMERGIAVKAIALRGDAREELVRKSSEVHADVLILGSRGLGVLKRTLLGSVSDYCAHNCTMPLVIVKMPPDTEKA
ncbi:hypothetical protein THASP1DRAFT_27048 [Thamnocephalis sphaerospora]|uniref:UspA domain-containing protein n=1 Tax=Thamnocephalis sphaerospora TaxID=78915 RepID=A0A4P9Y0B9_9FUNG|nr:hypothetical protein THASP1DRAFT_27048 [Thamnocephalis sphaerospora]|eukprot:RKP11210.1 hypothetical protein THASP1DRAFT_27048 [Thamnocephalis sphaerospora]